MSEQVASNASVTSDSQEEYNPYAASKASVPDADTREYAASVDGMAARIRAVFIGWEKLRLVFVALLGVETLAVLGPSGLLDLDVFLQVAFGAVVANMCFFAGPIVESYVTWLGLNGRWLRLVMFVIGTLATAFVALWILLAMVFPGPN